MNPAAAALAVKLIGAGRTAARRLKGYVLAVEARARHDAREKNPSRTVTPCHYTQLFVSHNGDVFPCCATWSRPEMRIGHLDDENLPGAIDGFYRTCSCEAFKLRKGTAQDRKDYLLNIELSLACQGNCAMCCVEAPAWRGTYDYYESLAALVGRLSPREILVQGGEVLIQKKSLAWLAGIKRAYPQTKLSLVTNGNVDLEMVEPVERLFDDLNVSIVGFQPETYAKIMGMNIEKTLNFVAALARRKKVNLRLKYLTTPINVHEAGLFLRWAIDLHPALIFFEDAGTEGHILRDAPHAFWEKIFQRTRDEIQTLLVACKDTLSRHGISVQISTACLVLLGLDEGYEKFLHDNGLAARVGRYGSPPKTLEPS